MSESSIGERKRALRVAALIQRGSLAREHLFSLGRLIQGKALAFAPYRTARAVILYSPVQGEVPTEQIRDDALASRKTVFYPKLSAGDSVAVARIHSAADLGNGRFGIDEPAGSIYPLNRELDQGLIFLPGLVFDRHGNRLGRGIGWYDRLLKELSRGTVFVGLGYESQVADEVPTDMWDEKVHYVITDKRIIDCGRSQSIAVS
jgi:5-formyltetrahydrofolate cyclo-ligase